MTTTNKQQTMKTLTATLTIALVFIASFSYAAQGRLTDVNPTGKMAFGIDENGNEVVFVNKQDLPLAPGMIVEYEQKGNGKGKGGAQVNLITSTCTIIGQCGN